MASDVGIVTSDLARNRARIYGFLATVYSAPLSDTEFEILRNWESLDEQLPEDNLPELMRRGLKKIRDWVGEEGMHVTDERKVELESEFMRLFRGLRRGPSPPPPYESVYADEGYLYGPSTDQVSKKYQQFNLKVQTNEPPDHLALELGLMRFLCEKEAEARDGNQSICSWLKEQDEFLNIHLAPWVPIFCEMIRKSCETTFYSGIIDLTEGWISCDQEIVRGLREMGA